MPLIHFFAAAALPQRTAGAAELQPPSRGEWVTWHHEVCWSTAMTRSFAHDQETHTTPHTQTYTNVPKGTNNTQTYTNVQTAALPCGSLGFLNGRSRRLKESSISSFLGPPRPSASGTLTTRTSHFFRIWIAWGRGGCAIDARGSAIDARGCAIDARGCALVCDGKSPTAHARKGPLRQQSCPRGVEPPQVSY